MKERYDIEISDIRLTVVSDESEDFVRAVEKSLNDRVNDLLIHNKRCSKLDAALLCALDYCSESAKAEKRIKNLEEQIALYDVRLKRMREEVAAGSSASVKAALGVNEAQDEAKVEAESEAGEEVAELEKLDAVDPEEDDLADIREALESLEEVEVKPEEKPKRSKLEEIEFLLRQNS